jgi:hypothetical protein
VSAQKPDLHRREDLAAVRRVEVDPNQDRIPLEVVKRLLDEENPSQGLARLLSSAAPG